MDSAFDGYEFSRACEALYHFAWDEFCDWYVELAKVQLAEGVAAHHRGAGRRAGHAAQAAAPGDAVRHRGAVEDLDRRRVPRHRRLAAALRLRAGSRCRATCRRHAEADHRGPPVPQRPGPQRPAEGAGPAVGHRRTPTSTRRSPPCGRWRGSPRATSRSARRPHVEVRLSRGTVVVELDTSGTVDVAAERRRLEKDLAAAEKELAGTAGKLGNEAFLAKAPDDVVDKIRARQQLAREEVDRITARLAGLSMSESRADPHRRVPTPDEIASLLQVEHLLDQRWPETKLEPSTARISALMELLGSPQRGYPSIHIAGTNGKTSVARMVDALLTALQSPHRPHHQPAPAVRGRAHLDRRQADQPGAVRGDLPGDRTVRAAGRPAVGGRNPGRRPAMSKFEVVTAMAFAAFADAPIDVAVVEVGLGGRWDATNVVDAPVAVITPIGVDHADYLGDTIAEIAGEKAGIITKQEDDRGADRHRRGDRPPGAGGDGSAAGAGGSRRRRGGARGFGVRGARPAGRRRWSAARAAGPRRGVLRHLPAAARRASGAQRGGRAGRGRGVLRRRRGASARHRRGARGLRRRHQPRPARTDAHRADGVHRRGAQPGRRRRAGPGARRRSSTSGSWSASSR